MELRCVAKERSKVYGGALYDRAVRQRGQRVQVQEAPRLLVIRVVTEGAKGKREVTTMGVGWDYGMRWRIGLHGWLNTAYSGRNKYTKGYASPIER